MSILTSLFTGVSGLSTNGNALSIVGDNIANGNTVGFKASRPIFGDVLSSALAGSSQGQIGKGVSMVKSQQIFTQGNFETSNNPLDMAIDGEGFFIAKEVGGGTFYTRAGETGLDKNGYMVTPTSLRMQGYLYDANGNPTGAIGDINVASVNSSPSGTSQANFQANLNANDTVPTTAWSVVAASGPVSGCYNFNTTISVYDTQGNAHPVGVYYRKTASNVWDAHFVYNDSANAASPNYREVDFWPATAGVTDPLTLTFNSTGTLIDVNNHDPAHVAGTTAVPNVAAQNGIFDFHNFVDPLNAATTQTVSITAGYNGVNTTQYGSPSTMLFQNQNGWTSGSLRSMVVSTNGIIGGVFTNGQVKNIAQIALARFVSPQGLSKGGKNLYSESFDSGQPVVGAPGTSGRGGILANSIELSTVDLAEQFVKMIEAQRGFQANAKVITTSDGMLNDVMNIVR